ncbi:hypothetical protein CCUS01_06422, partial [Colletotrichum cuscutae]
WNDSSRARTPPGSTKRQKLTLIPPTTRRGAQVSERPLHRPRRLLASIMYCRIESHTNMGRSGSHLFGPKIEVSDVIAENLCQ